ncbi:MAG: hypothetical protein BGP06_20700 [Rhizobiales bacterium 65-9]|nr:hypothetical protein [Hyphomicrobiales bacterium]OJY36451.1 MAG: hypothetical protein BGP06_20700 [Rhizobiales bacterium 65-9]
MKLLAASIGVAAMLSLTPAFAGESNPVEHAIKDRQLMTHGRYELPGPRYYRVPYAPYEMEPAYGPVEPAYGYGYGGPYGAYPAYGVID